MQLRGRFWLWVVVWTLIGLGIRIGTVIGRPHTIAEGDPFAYYNGAVLLVEGKGFINPFNYLWFHHQVIQSAAYAPGFMLSLTIPMLFGLKTWTTARIWSCVISAAAVTVAGMAGREVAGRRVGVIVAFLVAVNPNMWMNDEFVGAESIEPLVVAAIILFAYRFWRRPDFPRAIWFGVALAVAMLCRDELALLVAFILVPMCLLARSCSWKRRFALLGVGLLSTGVVVAPWVGYNMARFEKPTFITTVEGSTLASANCPDTFSGTYEGYWSYRCVLDDAEHIPKGPDESGQNALFQQMAVKFIERHENRIVPVVMAKIGRALGFFHPLEQIDFDSQLEKRPYHWALLGLGMYYSLLVLSIGGTIVLRRRRVPVYPLWAIGVYIVLSVAAAFGTTRYRLPFDVAITVMGAVAIGWAWDVLSARWHRRSAEAPAEDPASDEPEQPVPIPV
jgi:4-amino-4-deoxy-L-arabinose transferase-like glycosyltransferase